ncbi:MAG: divalent-cation tolerance protein CutA [Flavobacteriales bacterium]|nr:divalent-cation tolerance protein CutA [Flavobacteriales bacterium]
MSFIIVYVTNESLEEAERVTNHLLEKKLIACGNHMPIKSAYWWQGKIENEDEYVSLLKTRSSNWELVVTEVEKIHSYDTPCIIKFEAEANQSYEKWIEDETS